MPLNKYANGETQRTRPHRRVEQLLDYMGISYFSEKGFPPYVVDIYLTEWHLAIEVDGPMHTPRKDKARDEQLMLLYHLPVFRIKTSYNLGRDKIAARITKFIEANSEDAEERKRAWLTQP